MESRSIRWGLVGCGDVVERKGAPALSTARMSRIVAVTSRRIQMAMAFAQRHNIPKVCVDAEHLVADPDVDAVYIATPPQYHCEYALLVARAHKPVYVEKPMACSFDECTTMMAACAASRVPIFVAYYRRCLPRFQLIKKLLDEGAVGRIRAVFVKHVDCPLAVSPTSWRTNGVVGCGGRFVDVGSHTLDLLDYLLGPVREASGIATNQDRLQPIEDSLAASFAFNQGAVGAGVWSFLGRSRDEHVTLMGSEGLIKFSVFNPGPIEVRAGEKTASTEVPDPAYVQQPLVQTVVDSLLGLAQCPSTGETAMRTNWVIDRLIASRSPPRAPT